MESLHDQISVHDEFAENYDQQVNEYNSYGHEALFGMNYEFIKHDQHLLDLGIGTGLSSILFSRAGLSVIGVDGSEKMLQQCRKKNFTKELIQHDLSELPIPLESTCFDFIISCGLLHFFGDLSPMFNEVDRLLKNEGYFSFSVASLLSDQNDLPEKSDYLKVDTPWNVPIYMHTDKYVLELAENKKLHLLKKQRLLISGGAGKEDMLFTIFCTRKR